MKLSLKTIFKTVLCFPVIVLQGSHPFAYIKVFAAMKLRNEDPVFNSFLPHFKGFAVVIITSQGISEWLEKILSESGFLDSLKIRICDVTNGSHDTRIGVDI